jgi:hypothetical protein
MRWTEFVSDDAVDAPQSHAYRRIVRPTRGVVVQAKTQGPSDDWAPPQLQRLDASGPVTLKLHRPWLSRGELWLLEQAWKPVGMIERAARRTALRTASEEWAVEVRRRPRRLGWHLEFTREGAGQPALQYHPRGLPAGGHLTVPGGRRYTLRRSLLRGDWRLTAVPGGEIGRFEFRQREPIRYLSMQLAFVDKAVDEPMLLVVLLAASAAILIHDEQPRTTGAPSP